jgi:hypothetical protein
MKKVKSHPIIDNSFLQNSLQMRSQAKEQISKTLALIEIFFTIDFLRLLIQVFQLF